MFFVHVRSQRYKGVGECACVFVCMYVLLLPLMPASRLSP